MLRTQDSKTQFAPRLKTLRLKTLDPGRAGRYVVGYSVAGCSVAGCSVAGCSVVMRPVRWVVARSLRVRLGCFTSLHRQSTRNPVPRIMWTLELQRWPHTSDACGMRPDGCVRHGCLLVCSLGTLELEGALLLELTLTTICLGLDGASPHASRPWIPRARRRGKPNFSRGETAAKKLPPRSGGLWYRR